MSMPTSGNEEDAPATRWPTIERKGEDDQEEDTITGKEEERHREELLDLVA